METQRWEAGAGEQLTLPVGSLSEGENGSGAVFVLAFIAFSYHPLPGFGKKILGAHRACAGVRCETVSRENPCADWGVGGPSR